MNLDHDSIYAYVCEYEGESLLVMNHFYEETATFEILEYLRGKKATHLIGNYEKRPLEDVIELKPFETIAFILK